jgi:hypothetical protein
MVSRITCRAEERGLLIAYTLSDSLGKESESYGRRAASRRRKPLETDAALIAPTLAALSVGFATPLWMPLRC